MNILVKGRIYFEDLCGTPKEAEVMSSYRIISVNSVRVHENPPFSKKYWRAKNVLVLHFDDADPSDYPYAEKAIDEYLQPPKYAFMTESDAEAIVRFVSQPDDRPIIVHCTAGISRSGAIGLVLNEYFNRKVMKDEIAHERFRRLHAYICPNLHVMKLLGKRLGLE